MEHGLGNNRENVELELERRKHQNIQNKKESRCWQGIGNKSECIEASGTEVIGKWTH